MQFKFLIHKDLQQYLTMHKMLTTLLGMISPTKTSFKICPISLLVPSKAKKMKILFFFQIW